MRYTSTQTGFYTDPDLRAWGPLARYLYRYLYENDHAHGVTGIGRISEAVMLAELNMSRAQFERAKKAIGDKVRWYRDGSYWVVGRAGHTCFKRDGELNPKMQTAAITNMAYQCDQIKADFKARYPAVIGLTSDTPSMGMDTPYIPIEGEPNLPCKSKSKSNNTSPSPTPQDTELAGAPEISTSDKQRLESAAVQVFGALPAAMGEWLRTYPTDWIVTAILACETAQKRGMGAVGYCRGILQRYQREGGPQQPQARSRGHPATPQGKSVSLREALGGKKHDAE